MENTLLNQLFRVLPMQWYYISGDTMANDFGDGESNGLSFTLDNCT